MLPCFIHPYDIIPHFPLQFISYLQIDSIEELEVGVKGKMSFSFCTGFGNPPATNQAAATA